MKEKFYITTPIYYASGEPHIGHAFAVIYADVIARYKQQKDFDIFFLTGTDEHGSKIAEKAKAVLKNPQEYVDEISGLYVDLWKSLQIQNSDFIRTTSERHKIGVEKFIEKLWQAGDIYQGEYEGLYCVGCENFILEKDLANGLCPDHLLKPELVKEKNYFFNLKKYIPLIKEKIISDELKIIPESRKNEVLNILSANLPDFSITREKVQWGIPFPREKQQTVYVWVDALINYLSALDFPDGEKFKKYWPADAHIVGADINKFHSVYWPALLMSAGIALPRKIFIHGLFTVNGQKMGKTIGNVIDPKVLIEKFGSDAARYFLLSQFPAFEHGNIKESEFAEKYNADLANGIGNLFERVFVMVLKYGDIKKLETEFYDSEINKEFNNIFKNHNLYMENFQLFEALKEIFSFVRFLDKYINEKSPWELYKEYHLSAGNNDKYYRGRIAPLENFKSNELKDKIDKILNDLILSIEKIIELLSPFMPEKMRVTNDFLNKLKSGKINADEKLGLFPRASL